jgi:predicted RNA-binding Zn ribbon-like protein
VTKSRFKFVGGSLCLDFVNTATARTDVPLRDKLAGYDDLAEWGEAAGLCTQGHLRRSKPVHTRAIALREALYALFKSVIEGQKPGTADLAILQRELSIAGAHERLNYVEGEFISTWDAPDAPDRMLWPVARSAAELLTSEDRRKIRQCGGHECGWLFLDTSRNHGRQWCDMKICGNRAKLRRFRERRQNTYSGVRP